MTRLAEWLRADQTLNDGRGWTANLAIFRIVFLGFAVLPFTLRVLDWTERILPDLPRDVWAPISFYRLLPYDVLSNAGFARTLALADLALVLLGLIGFWTRSSIGLATLVSAYLFGLMENQGKVDHFHHLVWFMALLAAGPSGQLLSVDALRRTTRSADRGVVEPPFPSRDALWTLRYVWLLMGLLYLVPGLAKLEKALTGGWADATNLQNVLWKKWLELSLYDPNFVLPIRVDLLPAPLLELAGIGVIVFEIGFLFAVLFRRLRPALALAGLAFHVGSGLFLHIWFITLMPAYVCLFDWTAFGRALRRRGQGPLLVLYDGGCQLCRRTVAMLRSLDVFDALEPVVGLSNDPRRKPYPQITDDMLVRDLYVARGGRIAGGYDAYVRIAMQLVVLWPAALLMRCPPIAALGRRVYRRVADSRRCALVAPDGRQEAVRAPALRLIHGLGSVLVACQLAISSLVFLDGLMHVHLREPTMARWPATARWLVAGIAWRVPGWPFDQYPTFADPVGNEIEIWEARWVLSDGREMRISARVYEAAFTYSGRIWGVMTGIRDERDPERHRARSLDLVRALWQRETRDVRQSVTAVKIYRARYRLQPSEHAAGRLLSETVVHMLPVDLVSHPAA